MKRIVHYGLFLVLGVGLFFACKEDDFSELDATREQLAFEDSIQSVRDSLEKVGGIIDYSVNVVAASGAGFLNDSDDRVDGDPSLEGVTVTVSQHGTTQIATTDASGIASFADLRIGTVSVSIDDDEYTSVDMIVYLSVNLQDSLAVLASALTGVERQAATLVPLFSTTQNLSTVTGRVTFEQDLTDTLVHDPAAGVFISASIDFDDSDFRDTYFPGVEFYDDGDCQNCKEIAKIVNIAWSDAVLSDTTNSSGIYTIQVPSTANGLPIKLDVSDLVADQTLLMDNFNGDEIHDVRTVRTIFAYDPDESSYDPSNIPDDSDIPRALAFVDPPTGDASNPPVSEAEATAYLTPSGIVSITIENDGVGYTQPPTLVIDAPDDPFGIQATAEAFISNGRITSVEITEPGSGYDAGSSVGIDLETVEDDGDPASATPYITYSVVDFENTVVGQGYTSEPNVIIESGEGSGATARAVLSGTVDDVTVNTVGSGFIAPPEVNFIGEAEDEADATAVMTDHHPIHSIILGDNFDDRYETPPSIEIQDNGFNGSGAQAIAALDMNNGALWRIELTNAGSGYVSAPSVYIIGGGGQAASADAEINSDGEVESITIREQGFGFTSTPTIEISAPVSGTGVQATATAVLAYEISSIQIVNPGSGYEIAYNTADADDYQNEPAVFIDGDEITTDVDVTVRPNMSVLDVNVTDGGSGYESVPTVVFNPVLDYGSGATATAEITFEIDELELVTGGSGYEFSSVVNVIVDCDECTTRAQFSADLGDGELSSIMLTDPGEGYTAQPNVRLLYFGSENDDTEEVMIQSTIANGEVTGFNILASGGNLAFSNPANFTLDIRTYLDGANLSANVFSGAGQLEQIQIDDPGAGYVVAPIVSFDNEDTGGSGAAAVARIQDGLVVEITITNPGSGYVDAPDVDLVAPTFVQTAEIDLTISNDGRITDLDVDNVGTGYVEIPGITIVPILPGRGSGATAAIEFIENGGIGDPYITNQGSGYTGRNIPQNAVDPRVLGDGVSLDFDAFTDQTYVRDIYLGTGVRTTEDFE